MSDETWVPISRAVAGAMFRFCLRLAIVWTDAGRPQEADMALQNAIGWASR